MNLTPNHRRAVIQGLWELADAVAQGLPIPLIIDVHYRPPGESDAEKRSEIDDIAAALGVKPEYSASGECYSVRRRFNAVHYSAIMVSRQTTVQYDSLMTYDPVFDPSIEQRQIGE